MHLMGCPAAGGWKIMFALLGLHAGAAIGGKALGTAASVIGLLRVGAF
jgi:hypothetical protein